MPIPDFQTLMLPVLKYGNEGVISTRDAVEKASNEFDLTETERQETVPSGQKTRIDDRVSWAIVYLVKVGLLERPKRAHFTITDRGREVLATNPDSINVRFLRQFEEFNAFQSKKETQPATDQDEVEPSLTTPDERIGAARKEITAEVKSQLLLKVTNLPPESFEQLILKLLVAMGYGGSVEQAGTHLGKSGDGGVDGVINEDRLGLGSIYIQAKRYAPDNSVGRPEIQQFAGSLMDLGTNKGVFVTTSSYSKQAKEYADRQGIRLIDGDELTSLMLDYNVGVRINHTIYLKRIDEDFFLEL